MNLLARWSILVGSALLLSAAAIRPAFAGPIQSISGDYDTITPPGPVMAQTMFTFTGSGTDGRGTARFFPNAVPDLTVSALNINFATGMMVDSTIIGPVTLSPITIYGTTPQHANFTLTNGWIVADAGMATVTADARYVPEADPIDGADLSWFQSAGTSQFVAQLTGIAFTLEPAGQVLASWDGSGTQAAAFTITAAVPEPGGLSLGSLLALGWAGWSWWRRRRTGR
jgi:hypothetical protein